MSFAPRLVIALAVASLLAVFLVYQVAAGSGQLIVTVGQLRANKDGAAGKTVQLTGTAVSCGQPRRISRPPPPTPRPSWTPSASRSTWRTAA